VIKLILGAFLGLFLIACAIATAFFYLTGLADGSSPLLFVLSIVLVSAGVYILYRAGRININQANIKVDQPVNKAKTINPLERNSQLIAEYAKTSEAADRLKVLEMSAKAEEEK